MHVLNGVEAGQIGDDAAHNLRTPEHRVPAPASGEPATALCRPPDSHGHISTGRRQQHTLRHPVHEVAEVVGSGLPRVRIERDPAVQ